MHPALSTCAPYPSPVHAGRSALSPGLSTPMAPPAGPQSDPASTPPGYLSFLCCLCLPIQLLALVTPGFARLSLSPVSPPGHLFHLHWLPLPQDSSPACLPPAPHIDSPKGLLRTWRGTSQVPEPGSPGSSPPTSLRAQPGEQQGGLLTAVSLAPLIPEPCSAPSLTSCPLEGFPRADCTTYCGPQLPEPAVSPPLRGLPPPPRSLPGLHPPYGS